nr:hypothetical protein [Candidatus Krumholzibacteria bacterium]
MKPAHHRFHTTVLVGLGLAVAALTGWTLWQGWEFYATALSDRPHHLDFRTFRPAGSVGHGLGILGSAMIILLL